jgi:hypothetical protein
MNQRKKYTKNEHSAFKTINNKGKGKVFPVLNNYALQHEGILGGGYIDPCFFDIGNFTLH